jgi:hypothetical protein
MGQAVNRSPFLPNDPQTWEMRCPEVTFTIAGRWWRFFAGVTFKTKRLRHYHGYGIRHIVIRLWGARVIGISTRPEER